MMDAVAVPDPPLQYIIARLLDEFPGELAEDQWRNPRSCTVANAMRIRSLLARKLGSLSVDTTPAPRISAEALLNVARGCHDYNGGYRGGEKAEAFHHGIQTVINALEGAMREPESFQVRVLESIGAQQPEEERK